MSNLRVVERREQRAGSERCDVVETTLPSPVTARGSCASRARRAARRGACSIIEAACSSSRRGRRRRRRRPTCGAACIGSGSGSGNAGSCSAPAWAPTPNSVSRSAARSATRPTPRACRSTSSRTSSSKGASSSGEAHVLSLTKLEVLDLRDNNNLYGGFDHTHIPAAPLAAILLGGNLLNGPMPRSPLGEGARHAGDARPRREQLVRRQSAASFCSTAPTATAPSTNISVGQFRRHVPLYLARARGARPQHQRPPEHGPWLRHNVWVRTAGAYDYTAHVDGIDLRISREQAYFLTLGQ